MADRIQPIQKDIHLRTRSSNSVHLDITAVLAHLPSGCEGRLTNKTKILNTAHIGVRIDRTKIDLISELEIDDGVARTYKVSENDIRTCAAFNIVVAHAAGDRVNAAFSNKVIVSNCKDFEIIAIRAVPALYGTLSASRG